MNSFTIVTSTRREEELQQYIQKHLKQYNDARSPFHLHTRNPENILHLNLSVLSEKKDLVGGIICRLYWQWLEIEDIFLHQNFRSQGIGSVLIQQVEIFAKSKGCNKAQVKTFSFQAKPFYEKLGYEVVGELADYPPGFSLYWLCKDLK